MLGGLMLVLALATLLWGISVWRRDVSIVDLGWGAGFVILAWFEFFSRWQPWRSVLLLALVTVWGGRLSAYLAWRNHGRPEDYRYAAMRAKRPRDFWWQSLYLVFWLQAVILWIVALPVQARFMVGTDERLSAADGVLWQVAIGTVLWCIGLSFETIADYQLARFRSRPENRGRVLDTGLWGWTRHPNYFGDFCVWWGLYLVSAGNPVPSWTIVGPIVMSILLTRVSGVRLLEHSLRSSKPGYAEYVQRTSPFFPWPPRRNRVG